MLNSIRGNEPIADNTSATKNDNSKALKNGANIGSASNQKSTTKYINPKTLEADKLSDISQAKIELATKTLKKELSEELNRDIIASNRKNMANDRANNQETAFTNSSNDDLSPRVQELRRRQRVVIGMGDELTKNEHALHKMQETLSSMSKFFAASEIDLVQFEDDETHKITLQENMATIKNQLQDTRQQISAQAAQIDVLESGKRASHDLLELARKELIHSIEGAKSTVAKLEMKTTQEEKLNNRVNELQEMVEAKTNENNSFQKETAVHISSTTRLNDQISKQKKQNEQLEKTRSNLVDERDKVLHNSIELQKNIASLTNSNSDLSGKLDTVQLELKSTLEDFEIKTGYHKNEISALKSTIVDSEQQTRTAEKREEIANLENAGLKSQIGIETAKRIDYEKRCIEQAEKISDLERSLEQSHINHDALKSCYLLVKSEVEQQKIEPLRPARKNVGETPPMQHTNELELS